MQKTSSAFAAIWLLGSALALPGWAAEPSAATPCKDGTTSTATGRGACSGHGGVQKAPPTATAHNPAAEASSAPAAPAAAASIAAPAAPAAAPGAPAGPAKPAPSGATAQCKDGSYSKSQHRSGTCSGHGGVAVWLNAK